MNDSDPSPINLDELRLLPAWLREEGPAPAKQYASHDYPTEERTGRGGRGDQRREGGGFGRDRREARGSMGGSGRDDRRREGGRRPGGPPPRTGGRPSRDERGAASGPPVAPPAPAPVSVEFLPDERCLASINKQIRSTHLAYPLFGLARMFLQEPERHLVQFTLQPEAAAAGAMLYQLGEDGPITLDRATLEKIAFDASKEQFYAEETVQKEPLKGNFANVARDRQSGTLLGPTNHHGYQPALRALYESRFSRRMSFEDYRRGIEVSTDPALIERWKEEARTTTTIKTREENPVMLQNVAEARQHFRQHHFEGLLRTGTKLSVHGSVARKLPEPAMMLAIREAHERELRYPAQFVQLLRQGLQNAGLHIFKHRKRIVYVSLSRPTPFVANGAVSENVRAVLETIAEAPLCTRKALAERVLSKHAMKASAPAAGEQPAVAETTEPGETTAPQTEATAPSEAAAHGNEAAAPDVDVPPTLLPTAPAAEDPLAKAKAALAADLRFLVQSGHIIEFHNGTFDLPLPPKPKEEPGAARTQASRKAAGDVKPAESRKDVAPEPSSMVQAVDAPLPEADAPSVGNTPRDGATENEATASSTDEASPVKSPEAGPAADEQAAEGVEEPTDSVEP